MESRLHARILERREPAPDHVELIVTAAELEEAVPGQFAHVWTDHPLRRPISFSRIGPGGRAGLLFRVVGVGTRWLAGRQAGETLDLLAPLGRGFPTPETTALCLVGGGVGIPPLYAACERWGEGREVTVILGARQASLLLMADDFRRLGVEPEIVTDDGSLGETGQVTGPLGRWLDTHPGGTVLACGPTPMLEAVSRLSSDGRAVYLAFEQRMGCGVGACLACVVPGQGEAGPAWLRVCHDGPVFRSDQLWWPNTTGDQAP
jgi:dihydroorotate dehydrogenase electron transfer subunit